MIYGATLTTTAVTGGIALSGASMGTATVFIPLYVMGAKGGVEEGQQGFQQLTEEYHPKQGQAILNSRDLKNSSVDIDWYSIAGQAAVSVIADVVIGRLGGKVIQSGIKQIDKVADQAGKGAKNLLDTFKSGKTVPAGASASASKTDKSFCVNGSTNSVATNPKNAKIGQASGEAKKEACDELTKQRAELRKTDTSKLTRNEKGVLGEKRTAITLQRAGYEELPARLPRNNGFDGVWIKRDAKGSIEDIIVYKDIIITESKFSTKGKPRLSNTSKGPQMGDDWIEANIEKMIDDADPSVKNTGKILEENMHLIRRKGVVIDASGQQRFNRLKLPETKTFKEAEEKFKR